MDISLGADDEFHGACDMILRIMLAVIFWFSAFVVAVWLLILPFAMLKGGYSSTFLASFNAIEFLGSFWFFAAALSSMLSAGFMRQHLAGQRRIARAIEIQTAMLDPD